MRCLTAYDACRGDKYHDSGLVPYGTSKAMLIMFSWELQRRLAGTGVDVFMAHPGGWSKAPAAGRGAL
jgi:NAD(P)-dependent dehydrogenase (short-subunit alcohol dehydrogenase family)